MLALQEYLNSSVPVDQKFLDLKERIGVSSTRHGKHMNLVLFKYDKRPTLNWGDPILKECNGILLDEDKGWIVVGRSFDKMFNYGERLAPLIEWDSIRIESKSDGHRILMYPYRNNWHVATTTSPGAKDAIPNCRFSFGEFFWKTFYELKLSLPRVDCDHCFTFELTSRYNRVVVQHKETKLTLLGARNLLTQQELSPIDTEKKFAIGAALPTEYSFPDIDYLTRSFRLMDPHYEEGYVLTDKNFNRAKIRSPGYIALRYGSFSKKAFLDLVRSGEMNEVLLSFPEFKGLMLNIRAKYELFISEVEAEYQSLKSIQSQKEFADKALNTRCSGAMFAMRSNLTRSVKTFISGMRLENLAYALKLNDSA